MTADRTAGSAAVCKDGISHISGPSVAIHLSLEVPRQADFRNRISHISG